jgi:hypothetical protein
MGLLDEAIREHLELKRRRGADATEITRQEQEAFGPTRRGDLETVHEADPEPALDAPAEFAAEETVTTLHAVEDAPVQSDPPRPHGDPADSLPHVEAAPVQEHTIVEPPAATSQPTRAFDPEEVREASGLEPEAEAEAPVAPPRPEEDEAEPDGEGDVLEETPEFLQETPEHDRLWFEQRPPRDFDF